MKEFIVGTNDAGQRLDRWLAKTLPLLPAPLAQKYIRLKRVKLNGRGAKRDVRLVQGDLLQLYINDEFFQTPTPENAFLSLYQPKLTILYEDEHILLVDKRPGLVVHPDETGRVRPSTRTTARNTAKRSSTTSRPTSTRKRSGPPTRRGPLPPPCATVSTGTPGASSSPPKRRRDFG